MDKVFIWFLKKHASVRLINSLMRYGIDRITRHTDIDNIQAPNLGLRSKADFNQVQKDFNDKINKIK